MTKKLTKFAIIGGDMRQIYLAKSLVDDGFDVKTCGFDNNILSEIGIKSYTLNDACSKSDAIVLPLPTTTDKKTINTPLLSDDSQKIIINQDFFDSMKNKTVFCGQFKNFENSNSAWKTLNVKDYYESNDFAILNSVPTAEAALALGILETKITLRNSNCLVTGFGRVGEAMASILKNIGANVTILSRSKNKSAKIKTLGYDFLYLPDDSDNRKNLNLTKFDIIYNSIPCIIFDYGILKNCKKTALIIDLASKPGGVDFSSAQKLGIKTIHALALPGRYSPQAAANIIKQVILEML